MSKAKQSWVDLADDRLVVFPARSFFSDAPKIFGPAGIPDLDDDDRLLLGLCARMAKEGHSLALSVPNPDRFFFVKLLAYLHRVRIDALTGHVVGARFHSEALWNQRDLVWFGKPAQLIGLTEKVPGLNVCRPSRTRGQGQTLHGRSSQIARTPLVPFSVPNIGILDVLHEQTRPFAFVIDATPLGSRDVVKEIWDGLSVYFPEVPVLVVSALGDRKTDALLKRLPLNKWVHRLEDQHQWINRERKKSLPYRYHLVDVPDTILDNYLAELHPLIFHFKKQLSAEPSDVCKATHGSAAKVLQWLANLSTPLATREKHLIRNIRRGPFAVRPISRELDILAETPLKYGELESQRKVIHEKLTSLYSLINEGETGKYQALRHFIAESVEKKQSILVLVGTLSEEEAVVETINSFDLTVVDNVFLSVKPAGAVKSAQSLTRQYDRCLILTQLWDNTMWWLAGVARQIFWLTYPFQMGSRQRDLGLWERDYLCQSEDPGDKKALLTFSWPRGETTKDQVTAGEKPTFVTMTLPQCQGSYAVDKAVVIERTEDATRWLLEILAAEEEAVEDAAHKNSGDTKDCARISVEESRIALFWPVNRPVSVLCTKSQDGIVNREVSALVAGDQIICVEGGNPYAEILYALFETFHASSSTTEVLRWVTYWDSLVDSASELFSNPTKLRTALQQLGTDVSLATVRGWLNKNVMGPEEQTSIKNMALVTGQTALSKHAPKIHRALERIRTEHRQIGKDLHKALLSRAAGATTINVGSMRLDTESLDDLLNIYTVEGVTLPGEVPAGPKRLSDLVPRIQSELGDKLLLTTRAIRSMENTTYRNLEKAWSCFDLAANDLWGLYNKEKKLADVRNAFQQAGMALKMKTSAITQGMSSDYEARYEGKPVDIGAHLCLGTARDTSKTMRVHFHWDDKKSLIVIHHAGRHLKTRLS